jgi:hypothetical protein
MDMLLRGEDIKVFRRPDGPYSIGVLGRQYIVKTGGVFPIGYCTSKGLITTDRVEINLTNTEKLFLTNDNKLVLKYNNTIIDLISKKMYKGAMNEVEALRMDVSTRKSIILSNS